MKKLVARKLVLSRESLRQLEQPTLRQVEGAGGSLGECTGPLSHCVVCPA